MVIQKKKNREIFIYIYIKKQEGQVPLYSVQVPFSYLKTITILVITDTA